LVQVVTFVIYSYGFQSNFSHDLWPLLHFFSWWNDVERPVNNFHHTTFSDIVIICCYVGGRLEISYMCSLYCINVQNSHTKMEFENVSPLPLLFVCDMLKRKHDFQYYYTKASWSRLEMKPKRDEKTGRHIKWQKGHKTKRGHGSGTLIANLQALLSIAKSLLNPWGYSTP
jgi:hypothetical protein